VLRVKPLLQFTAWLDEVSDATVRAVIAARINLESAVWSFNWAAIECRRRFPSPQPLSRRERGFAPFSLREKGWG
jgi:hypothetical protein